MRCSLFYYVLELGSRISNTTAIPSLDAPNASTSTVAQGNLWYDHIYIVSITPPVCVARQDFYWTKQYIYVAL
jgi:hypothetical protein